MLKNSFEVVFLIISKYSGFPESMFIPKFKNDKKTEFEYKTANVIFVYYKMKKAISIFLLGIFLFNTAGYFVFFKIAQIEIKKEIKKEIKLNLQSEELTAITFLNSEIQSIPWIETNKEFIFRDQMFDVVKSESNETETTFYCINDKQ